MYDKRVSINNLPLPVRPKPLKNQPNIENLPEKPQYTVKYKFLRDETRIKVAAEEKRLRKRNRNLLNNKE